MTVLAYDPTMRLRLRELLAERDMTAYALVAASSGRIDMSTAYRLLRSDGRVQTFSAELLEALCDALDVEVGELLEREGQSPARRRRKRHRR